MVMDVLTGFGAGVALVVLFIVIRVFHSVHLLRADMVAGRLQHPELDRIAVLIGELDQKLDRFHVDLNLLHERVEYLEQRDRERP